MTGHRSIHSTPTLTAGPVVRRQYPRLARRATDVLSASELRALALLAEGFNYKQIAERVYVSEGAVKGHLARAYAKLQAKSGPHAVAIAFRRGLLEADDAPFR